MTRAPHPRVARVVLALLLVCLPASGRQISAAENPPRVAILPFAQSPPDPVKKQEGETIADFLQIQLHDLPGVDWVERAALDQLLAEAELQPSAIALGRLLKADVLIQGRLNAAWEKVGISADGYARHGVVEITDLTNASILVSKDFSVQVRRMPASGNLEAASLGPLADQVRRLLLDALEERRAAAKAVALAPVFFANAGASARLDGWEERILDGFESAARAFPQMRMLRFRGAAQASGEQRLALLGLTDADPMAWQSAAQGYLWGSYRELPADAATAFEDIQAEAEIFLWMGGQPPQRFARQFAVKDFDAASGVLIREALEQAARLGRPAPANHAEQIAAMIFGNLGEMINEGYFTKDGRYRSPAAARGYALESMLEVDALIRQQPFGDKKVAYCKRALDLACFFDPLNARMPLLRAMFMDRYVEAVNKTPDEQLAPLAACVTQLQRMARQPDCDMRLFAHGADFTLRRWNSIERLPRWKDQKAPPASVAQRRDRLIREFRAFFLDQLPETLRRFDTAGLAWLGRQETLGWLANWLHAEIEPETKFRFFETVWPVIGPYMAVGSQSDVDTGLEELMKELGDRKRVQAILTKFLVSKELIAQDNAQRAAEFQARSGAKTPAPSALRPSLRPPSRPPWESPSEPLIEGLRIAEAPVQNIRLPGPPEAERGRPSMSPSSMQSMAGFGDQLIFSVPSDDRRSLGTYYSYQVSTHQSKLLVASKGMDSLCVAHGRALYRQGDVVGWTDLLSGESGEFLPEKGLPIGVPSMLGWAGSRYAVVADGAKRVAGLFDWFTGKWISPPAPPPPAADAVRSNPSRPVQPFSSTRAAARTVVGTDDVIFFPEWNLVYHADAQRWQEIPPLPPPPPPDRSLGSDGSRGASRAEAEGALLLDGDLWRWNSAGISQYSLEKKSEVWRAGAFKLAGAWADGPGLWIAFDAPEFGRPQNLVRGTRPPMSRFSLLLLLDRASHRTLGAVWVPQWINSLYVDAHEMWVQSASNLHHADKADLYAALGQKPPPPQEPAKRPIGFESGDSALYAAILREDTAMVRGLLDHRSSVAENIRLGLHAAPALLVAAWTGNAEIVNLLRTRGARLENAASAPTPSQRYIGFATAGPPPDSNWTPLTAAARRSDPATARLLLDAGAKANPHVMRVAADYGHVEVAAELAKAGEPIQPALELIKMRKNAEAARRLLETHLPLLTADQAWLENLAGVKTLAPNDPALADDPAAQCAALKQALEQRDENRALELVRLMPAASLGSLEVFIAVQGAIYGNFPKVVEAFLDRGFDPNAAGKERKRAASPSKPGRMDRMTARSRGSLLSFSLQRPEIFKLLLRRGADPTLEDMPELTCLERAAGSKGGSEVLPSLLEHYPPVNTKLGYGTVGGSALCAAAANWEDHRLQPQALQGESAQRADAIRFLIERGVPPSAPGREGNTALHIAFAMRDPAMACLLAGCGADLQARDLAGRTIFDLPYLHSGKRDAGFEQTLQKYAPPSDTETRGKQRLLEALQSRPAPEELREAVVQNDVKRAEDLLRRGAPVDLPLATNSPAFTQSDNSPGLVFTAAANRCREMAELLLRHGANPNIGESGAALKSFPSERFGFGLFSLMKQVRIVKWTPARRNGKTALIAAAESGDAAFVRLLLEHGANPVAQDAFHRTAADAAATPEIARAIGQSAQAYAQAEPLSKAMSEMENSPDSRKIVEKILRSAPETLKTLDDWGATRLASATRIELDVFSAEPSLEITLPKLALLRQCGLPLNSLDDYGMSPLHWAVLYGSREMVAEMVKTGLDPSLPDARGTTSLQLASTILNTVDRAEITAALQSPAGK